MTMKRMSLIVWLVMLAWATTGRAEESRPFVFLKTGEKFATQDTAGPTVAGLTGYLGVCLGGTTNAFDPRIFNDPKKAVEFCVAQKPVVGIVTPGFYLAYVKALGMEPVLETRREKVPAERYVLVAKKAAGDKPADFAGKTIATALAGEQYYVMDIILDGKLGEEIRLKAVTDIEGAVFDIIEGTKNAADAVLMEEGMWKSLFEPDSEVGPKMKVVYQSAELPRDLVVVFKPNAGSLDTGKLSAALKGMSEKDDGRQVLRSIRVEAFVDVDQDRLAKARERFHAN